MSNVSFGEILTCLCRGLHTFQDMGWKNLGDLILVQAGRFSICPVLYDDLHSRWNWEVQHGANVASLIHDIQFMRTRRGKMWRNVFNNVAIDRMVFNRFSYLSLTKLHVSIKIKMREEVMPSDYEVVHRLSYAIMTAHDESNAMPSPKKRMSWLMII